MLQFALLLSAFATAFTRGLRRIHTRDEGLQAAEALALAGVGVVVIVVLMGLLQSTGERVIEDLEGQIINNQAGPVGDAAGGAAAAEAVPAAGG